MSGGGVGGAGRIHECDDRITRGRVALMKRAKRGEIAPGIFAGEVPAELPEVAPGRAGSSRAPQPRPIRPEGQRIPDLICYFQGCPPGRKPE